MKTNEWALAVRSYIPGRLRLRLPFLREISSEDWALVQEWLMAQHESVKVQLNPRVGSVLLTWDAGAFTLSPEKLLTDACAWLEAARSFGMLSEPEPPRKDSPQESALKLLAGRGESLANNLLDAIGPVVARDVKSPARRRRVSQNRLMLASLAASVLVLSFKGSKAHVAWAGAFLALLALHLWQHKKVL